MHVAAVNTELVVLIYISGHVTLLAPAIAVCLCNIKSEYQKKLIM